jgi:hypothetical protein
MSTHKLNLPFSVSEGIISKEKDSGITYDLQYIKTRASKGVWRTLRCLKADKSQHVIKMHVMLLWSGLSVEGHNMYDTEKSVVKVRLILQRVRD